VGHSRYAAGVEKLNMTVGLVLKDVLLIREGLNSGQDDKAPNKIGV
jgi:hypothetical protein